MPRDLADVEPHHRAVGEAIRDARERAKLSRAELAKRLLYDSDTICRWELGQRSPLLWQLPEIATALGISAERLAKKISEKIAVIPT